MQISYNFLMKKLTVLTYGKICMIAICRMDQRDGIGGIKRKEDLLGLTKAQAKISVIEGMENGKGWANARII